MEKYKSCRYLNNGINFYRNTIRACNNLQFGPVLLSMQEKNSIDWKNIDKVRETILERLKNGEFPESCLGCVDLEEKNWEEDSLVKYIEVCHWTHCNCSCFYCSNMRYTLGKHSNKQKESDYVKLYPILKKMISDKMLSEDVHVSFVGGEPSVLKEFPKVIDLLHSNKITNLDILSSGILYSKAIHKALKKGAFLSISIDCGNPELYLRIKRVNEFNSVVKNIKKYLSDEGCVRRFVLKYIILDGYNDTEESLVEWMELARRIGVENLSLSFEYCHASSVKKGQPVPSRYYELFAFAKEKAKEYNLYIDSIDLIKNILNKGYY